MNMRRKSDPFSAGSESFPPPDLSDSNLAGASLRRANLAGAILHGANLQESDLQGANLRLACLYGASLEHANLCGANLGMSDLRFARLEGANLSRVNFCRANLLGARLAGSQIEHVDLAGAILPDGTPYRDDTCLDCYTDTQNPAFAATLRAVQAVGTGDSIAKKRESDSSDREMSWTQFVERTYGSLADDPIEWHPPSYVDHEDSQE